MAYVNEADAGILLTGVTALGSTIHGVLGCRLSKQVRRIALRADGHKTPYARPVVEVDAQASVRFLALDDAVSEDAAAGTIVASFSCADGGSGSITMGNFVAGDVENDLENGQGFTATQQFEMVGSSLTYTVSI